MNQGLSFINLVTYSFVSTLRTPQPPEKPDRMFARSKRNLTWFEVGPTSLPPLPALHKATMSVHAAFGRPSALPLPRSSALSSSAPSVATKGLPNRHHVAGGPSDPRQRRAGSSTPPNTIIAQQALLPSTNAATDSAAPLPAPVSVQNRLKRPFSCANNQQPPSRKMCQLQRPRRMQTQPGKSVILEGLAGKAALQVTPCHQPLLLRPRPRPAGKILPKLQPHQKCPRCAKPAPTPHIQRLITTGLRRALAKRSAGQ